MIEVIEVYNAGMQPRPIMQPAICLVKGVNPMYELLIVEDENKTREALRRYLPWQSWSIGTVYEAANGAQALSIARDKQPDFVLTDIRMPVMDGIELAERLVEQYPDIVILMLSAYSDLSYLKSAMKTNAVDYLLKPVDPEELGDVMQAAIRRKKENEKLKLGRRMIDENLPLLQEQCLLALLDNASIDDAQMAQVNAVLDIEHSDDALWCPVVFRFRGHSDQVVYFPPEIENRLKDVIAHGFRPFPRCFLVTRRGSEWVAVIECADKESSVSEVEAAVGEILTSIRDHMGIETSAIASGQLFSLRELHQGMKRIGRIERKAESADLQTYSRQSQLATEIKQYINEHYSEETLSVNSIAEHFAYTSAHVCMVFKKVTGITINQYINLHRIRVAKKLLEDQEMKMIEIAERVGYSNENYFSKVFRKYENMPPSDYRRKQGVR